ALITQPDTQPTAGRTQPHSKPPWNSEVAAALYDTVAAICDLHAELAYAVHGRYVVRPPYRQIGVTLRAIERLAIGVNGDHATETARTLDGCITRIMQLPAIDLEERWRRLPGPCPRCQRPMLRASLREGRVACLGCQRRGQMMPGAVSDGFVEWDD